MPFQSDTGNVYKQCGCRRWKECGHSWYVAYQKGKRRFRPCLDTLIGRHCVDFTEARAEARRAIVAWENGLDASQVLPTDRATLATLMEEYGKRPEAGAGEWYHVRIVNRTVVTHPDGPRELGRWRADEVTREAIEQFRRQCRKVAANRHLAYLRALYNWAVAAGLVPRTPFRVGDVAVVKLTREDARTRRLQPGEWERLLPALNSLQDLAVGALETGMRKGELLSLQWHQVRFFPRAEIFLPAQKTKAKKDRRIPISSVLRPVLEARRNDPAGNPLPPDAFVFGDEIGRRRGSIKTAWKLACKRANVFDLHFHDLRREAGSRWMDAGVALGTIQRWLGHHNVSQTSTYLAASLGNDDDAMRAFEQAAGRMAHTGTPAGSNGSQPTRTDSETCEKPPEVVIVPEQVGVVH